MSTLLPRPQVFSLLKTAEHPVWRRNYVWNVQQSDCQKAREVMKDGGAVTVGALAAPTARLWILSWASWATTLGLGQHLGRSAG